MGVTQNSFSLFFVIKTFYDVIISAMMTDSITCLSCNELVSCQTWRMQQLQSQSYFGRNPPPSPRPKTSNAGLNSVKASGKPWYKSSGLCFTFTHFDKLKQNLKGN